VIAQYRRKWVSCCQAGTSATSESDQSLFEQIMMNFQIASKVREIVYNKDTTYHTKLANREYGHISKKKI